MWDRRDHFLPALTSLLCSSNIKIRNDFAEQLYENTHRIGNTDEFMYILYVGNKGRHLSTIERYYIYLETKIKSDKWQKHCHRKFSIQCYNPVRLSHTQP